jgi:hypothetical protein
MEPIQIGVLLLRVILSLYKGRGRRLVAPRPVRVKLLVARLSVEVPSIVLRSTLEGGAVGKSGNVLKSILFVMEVIKPEFVPKI